MRSSARSTALTALLMLPHGVLTAQEALRRGIEVDQAITTQRQGWSQPTTGFRAGPVQLNVGASLTAEWNDNVTISKNNPADDFLLRPQADVQLFWPATEHARVLLGAGIGYTYYINGNREDRFYIAPNSLLAIDFPIGNAVYTIYDQARYSDDPTAAGDLAGGVQDYAYIDNTAGLRGVWSFDHWSFQAGYSYFNYYSLANSYDYLSRFSHQLYAQAAYVFEGGAKLGVEASGSRTDYSQQIRDDFYSASFGPFLEFAVYPGITVRARGGYVLYDFDYSPFANTPGDTESYYAGLRIEHQLSDRIRHYLDGVREIAVAIYSDYDERVTVTYGLNWAIRDPLSLNASLFYEHGREPQAILETEIYDRYGASLGVSYTLLPKLTAGVTYRFTYRDSDLADRDYTQNAVSVSIAYRW